MVRAGSLRVFNPQVVCPAGVPIFETLKGSGCRCRIESSDVLAAVDPSSLNRFCLSDYESCPSWRQERDAWWEDRLREFEREMAGASDEPAERLVKASR